MEKAGTRQQFVLLCVFSIAILIITVSIIIWSYSNTIIESNLKSIKNVVKQFRNEFSYNLHEIDQLVNGLAFNPSIKNYLLEEYNTYNKHVNSSELVKYFSSLKSIKPSITDISIFRPDIGRATYYDLTDPNSEFLKAFDEKPYSYCFGVVEYAPPFNKLLLSGCTVYNKNYMNDSEDKIGTVIIAVDPTSLSLKLQEISDIDNVQYIVYDEHNNIVIGNVDTENTEIMSVINSVNSQKNKNYYENLRYQVTVNSIDGLRGRIITVIDKNILLKPVKKSIFYSGIILSFSIAILVSLYYIAVRNVVRPINNIIIFLKNIQNGDMTQLKKRIAVEGNRDTRLLSVEFNNMLDEINVLAHRLVENSSRLYEMEIAKKQSEIALLRSQINPHFLYNTLEVIRAIAVIRGVTEIANVSKSLAKIMRYSIKGYENVTLSEELNIIKDYIQIQNVRYKGKIKAEYNIMPETLTCIIPKMSLQPIVENAVCHGIEEVTHDGYLMVSTELAEDTLIVHIVDNGIGIDEDTVALINEKLKTESDTSLSDGIGLLNVNSRIKLTQGEHYGVEILSKRGYGTEVRISFMVKEKKNV